MPIKKNIVRLSVDEKIEIVNHPKENPHISQNKITLDFLAKFEKQFKNQAFYSIDILGVSK